jgi:hypothetical protein
MGYGIRKYAFAPIRNSISLFYRYEMVVTRLMPFGSGSEKISPKGNLRLYEVLPPHCVRSRQARC